MKAKRIISTLMALILIVSTVCAAGIVSADAAKSVYSKTIASRYKESLHSSSFEIKENRAFFYDFDGNGKKELVLVEFRNMPDVYGMNSHNLYVYTSANGKVKTLVNGIQLGSDAGQGSSTKIGVAVNKTSGKKYVYAEWKYGGGDPIHLTTNRYYYTVKGSKISVTHRVKVNQAGDKKTYYINGAKKSKSNHDKWINAYQYSIKKDTLKSVYNKTR